VAESYPFGPGGTYLLSYDNHNSVNGIREFARARGADVVYAPVRPPDLRLDDARCSACSTRPAAAPRGSSRSRPSRTSRACCTRSRGWSAPAGGAGTCCSTPPPSRRLPALDLGAVRPDFVSLSFYKMFGYPTGVGALLARREALRRLQRPWFAGGTIAYASVTEPRHDLHDGAEAFEDGTLNYLALPAIEDGPARLAGGRLEAAIHDRAMSLTAWTLERAGGAAPRERPPARPGLRAAGGDGRGGAIAFNLLDATGALVDHREVERRANAARISLRTGLLLQPGRGRGGARASRARSSPAASAPRPDDDRHLPRLPHRQGFGRGAGLVGWASTFDAHALVRPHRDLRRAASPRDAWR
jgi:molybdenum cofactor sulfurtransferase